MNEPAILFITSGPIGDAILTSGVLRHLHDTHPTARFTIMTGPVAGPMFRDTPRLDALITIAKQRYGGHWLALWKRVRHRRWALVVDMRGSVVSLALRADKRAIRVKARGELVHKVIEAARVLGLDGEPPSPHLFVSATTEAEALALCPDDRPLIAFSTGATWTGKAWPAERFAELAAILLDRIPGGRLLLVGGPDDHVAAALVKRAVQAGSVIDLIGADLLVTYACLQRTRLFVGNDSGLMHLAAAAGAPTLGLFGPTEDRKYRPWGPRAAFIRGKPLADLRVDLPGFDPMACHMLDLSVTAVAEAAEALLARTQTPETASA